MGSIVHQKSRNQRANCRIFQGSCSKERVLAKRYIENFANLWGVTERVGKIGKNYIKDGFFQG